MFKNYSPLSTSVSPFLPDHLNNILPGTEISVSGYYIREGFPIVVLNHYLWDSRAHFIIRWILQRDQAWIALLEQVSSVNNTSAARQIFVRVNTSTSVTFLSQPEFMRVLQLVCSDIVANRLVTDCEKSRKLLDDVNRIFDCSRRGRITEPLKALARSASS
ncbi:MAG: hypothetical protein JST89_26300 [Cyanobacteria bacterium SZAS-4]|nr:hypothetical protein [Cyanobacteria bacterium SZAS-4]